MLTILSLFGRSPFAPLQTHMRKVAACVDKIPEVVAALEARDFDQLEIICQAISEMEHSADLTKQEIRDNLPKGMFLPIDRGNLLEILTLQDSIADKAEDVAILFTLKKLETIPEIHEAFGAFVQKNIDTFKEVERIVKEMQDLLESSFGGVEAQKVRQMVDNVGYSEHQVDVMQRDLVKTLYNMEEMDFRSFHLWLRIIREIGALSNISEKLANRVRMTLDLK